MERGCQDRVSKVEFFDLSRQRLRGDIVGVWMNPVGAIEMITFRFGRVDRHRRTIGDRHRRSIAAIANPRNADLSVPETRRRRRSLLLL